MEEGFLWLADRCPPFMKDYVSNLGRKLNSEIEAEVSEGTSYFFAFSSHVLSPFSDEPGPGAQGWNHSQCAGSSNINCTQAILLRHAHESSSDQFSFFLHMSSEKPRVAFTNTMLEIGRIYSRLERKIHTPKRPQEKNKQH